MKMTGENSIISFIEKNKLEVIKAAVYAFFLSLIVILLYTSLALNRNIISRKIENNELNKSLETQKELIKSLENQLFKREQLITNLNAIIESQSDALEFIQQPNLKIIKLHNYRDKIMNEGKLLLDLPNKKAILLAKDLGTLSEGTTYQLWAYLDNEPVSLGTFASDNHGNGILKVDYLPNPPDIIRYTVTIEPEGGSPAPTGEMYLIGSR